MKSILSIFLIMIPTIAFAGSFNECIDSKGHSTFTNSVCPDGFHPKNQPKQVKKSKLPLGSMTSDKPLILTGKDPREIKRACRAKWIHNNKKAKECMKRNLDLRVAELDNEINNRKRDLKNELSGMIVQLEEICKKDHRRGTHAYQECMQYARDERAELEADPKLKILPPKRQQETYYSGNINRYCKEVSTVSGGSYTIETGCREIEREAKAKLAKMSVPNQIASYCSEVANVSGGSYSIMVGCIEMELEAKSRM